MGLNWFERQALKFSWGKYMKLKAVRTYLPLIAVAFLVFHTLAATLGYHTADATLSQISSTVPIEQASPISRSEIADVYAKIAAAVTALIGLFLKLNSIAQGISAAKRKTLGLVVLLLLPSLAAAQEPQLDASGNPAPASLSIDPAQETSPAAAAAPQPKHWFILSTGATRFFTPGIGDRTELEGQVMAEIRGPHVVIEGFGRFTRTQAVEETIGGLLDVGTFRSIVAHLGLRREFNPYLAGGCTAGVSWDRDKYFDPTDPNVWAIGCGPRAELKGKGYLTVKFGHVGSVGGLAIFGELVIQQGASVRYVATYAVPFSADKFRQNPGMFTMGLQADVWRKAFGG